MRITKETQSSLGYYQDVQCLSLKQGEATLLKYQITQGDPAVPVDITSYTFEAEFIERTADSVTDTKNGISISGLATMPGANVVSLTANITVGNAATGNLTLYIPATLTSTEPTDPDSTVPVIYTGFLSVNDGGTPTPQIQKFQYILLVSNDGVS